MNIDVLRHSLVRQEKGFGLLHSLLEEEFAHLGGQDPEAVFRIELSIQQLLRQLALEREHLHAQVSELAGPGTDLSQLMQGLQGTTKQELESILARTSGLERLCSRQASVNAEMVLALVDQGQQLIEFLCREVAPRDSSTYSCKGVVKCGKSATPLLRGSM